MAKNKINTIPALDFLTDRFKFVDNPILRDNLAIAFQYIYFLIILENEYPITGGILYSLYKNMIFYTATIVESCLNYCIGYLINKKQLSEGDIMPAEWKYKNCIVLFDVEDGLKICGAHKIKTYEKFKSSTQFITLNKIAREAGILDNELFKKAEKLRVLRNRIHLAALDNKDDFYTKKDVETAFSYANNIISKIEERITKFS